ncbi:hypothetical protein [Bacillus sp. V5-8f]|uniref:hypothetical protein n=1 Tax=Bacillus sp. V5-8f TaxID=2053044 RepID=UPI000C78FD97|nr:hypothetical protein [Bacillus sp. V5-8f]PLT32530.1 hypothetical protein CUU64_18670 [Bacillus sp. V5-8f]
MGNKYLERINQLHKDIIVPNRIKYVDGKWLKRNKKANIWTELKVYNSGQVSLSHSRGTATYLSHLKFLLRNNGPYTIEQLVNYMYKGEFHKFYGWVEGFWDKETLLMYFNKLKENNVPLYEVYIRDNHGAFYKATRRMYKQKKSYRSFLKDMGENPDEVNGDYLVDKFTREGKYIEFLILKLLNEINVPYVFHKRFPSGATPDMYDSLTNSVIDIKRSIKTSIQKETSKYTQEFNKVTVIYLLGSREIILHENDVQKISIYKWLNMQKFFQKLSVKRQEKVLKELDAIVKSIDEGQFNSDAHDYHRKLVGQIIDYDKKGLNNPEIAKKVGISYKYVNLILQGKALQEYSKEYSFIYKAKQADKKKNKQKVVELFLQGVTKDRIQKELKISKDMVNYFLRNANLNEKVLIGIRNKKIHELLQIFTEHETLSDKFEWIADTLKQEYPSITPTIVHGYYYIQFVPLEGDKKIIKGKENIKRKIVDLFLTGRSRQEISEELNLPVTTVRSYLRKAELGNKDIKQIRNEKIEELLKEEITQSALMIKFEYIAKKLQEEFPNIKAKHIHTYYYTHFIKKN